jgi:bla regulator protein blaR1
MQWLPTFSGPVVQALGWSILHSCWQGLLVFAVLRFFLILFPKLNAGAKYNLHFTGLTAIAGWFAYTFFTQLQSAYSASQINRLLAAVHPEIIDYSPATTSAGLSFQLQDLQEYFPILTGAYLLGIIWFALRLLADYLVSVRLKMTGIEPADISWEKYIHQLSSRLQINKTIQLKLSALADIPMMIGHIKPVILFPITTFSNLSPEQLEAILLHELAHIRRNDYLVNLIQSVADILLFFNPFVWWISKKIREERENCCDEIVTLNTNPVEYAKALLSLEESRNHYLFAMAVTGRRKSLLLKRIQKITTMNHNQTNYRQKLTTIIILLLSAISLSWLNPGKLPGINKVKQPLTKVNSIYLQDNTAKNDTLPGSPPAPPQPSNLAIVSPPPPPPPPLPAADTIPMPDTVSMTHTSAIDTGFNFAFHFDADTNWTKMDSFNFKYFNSQEWKKQQALIRRQSMAIAQMVQSKEWKVQQEAIKKYFNSPQWQAMQLKIKVMQDSMKQYFNSPEWKAQQDAIKKMGDSLHSYFNSQEWKKQQEAFEKLHDSMSVYFKTKAWQDYQDKIQQYALAMQNYIKSAQWKNYQDQIQKYAQNMQQYVNSKAWKKQMEEQKEMEMKVRDQLSKDSRKNQQAMRQLKIQMRPIDSVRAQQQKQEQDQENNH